MVTSEDGPFDVFISLRSWLGAYNLDAQGQPRSWTGRGIRCIYCVSFWIGLLCGLLVVFGYGKWLVPMAVPALALYVHRLVRRE